MRVRGEDLTRAAADREDVTARIRGRAEELRRRRVERRSGGRLLRVRESLLRGGKLLLLSSKLGRGGLAPVESASRALLECEAVGEKCRLAGAGPPAGGPTCLTANRRLERNHLVADPCRLSTCGVEVHLQPVERECDRLVGAIDIRE